MKYIDKNQVKEVLGKLDIFKEFAIIGKAVFIGGIAEFEDESTVSACFYPHEKGLLLTLLVGFSSYRFAIVEDQLDFVSIEPQQRIMDKKDKSIVGRALIGGLLLGPVGAIVGGMTGIGQKEVKAKTPENILIIKSKSYDQLLTFSVSDNNLDKVTHFFKMNYPSCWKVPEEMPASSDSIVDKQLVSVADELVKLKSLLDSGVLSQEEFDGQKKKLLSS